MNGPLSKEIKVTLVKATQTSAGTAVNSDGVDMTGWEGVIFLGAMHTANAGNSANAAQGADNSNFDDLEGTKIVPGDNGDSFMIDVYRPKDRYVRCEVVRAGANTVLGEIYAIQYRPLSQPTTQGATIDAETHVSPAEGTA
jgi:hypothetical protein